MWRSSLVACLLVLGCSPSAASGDDTTPASGTDGSTAPTIEPPGCTYIDASACIMPAPSYEGFVVPLLDRACNSTCHAPGNGPWPLTDYSDVSDWATIIFGDVESCAMPPADAGMGSLSDEERALLLDWIACGAPDTTFTISPSAVGSPTLPLAQ